MTIYRVTCGAFERDYYTPYHAEQMAAALRKHPPLKDVPVSVEALRMPNDALTKLVTQ